MIVRDFSPYIENKTGKDDNILLHANMAMQFNEAVSFCKKYFNASFPCENIVAYDFKKCKSYFHRNAKMLLHCFYNTITGKYDLQVTTKSIQKTYKGEKYNFIGNLTDYAFEGGYKEV